MSNPKTIKINGKKITLKEFSEAKKLIVKHDLYLSGTGITTLPDSLHVEGSLDLSGTGITTLPDSLHVGGWLDLRGTGITTLPDSLHVGGWLYLDPYKVDFLPDNYMKIGCENHSFGDWAGFNNSRIASMEGKKALKFWKIWRDPLLNLCESKRKNI